MESKYAAEKPTISILIHNTDRSIGLLAFLQSIRLVNLNMHQPTIARKCNVTIRNHLCNIRNM